MYLPGHYELGLIRREEQARLEKRLTLGRLLREGRPARSSWRNQFAVLSGRALVAFGQWLIARARSAAVADSSWTLG